MKRRRPLFIAAAAVIFVTAAACEPKPVEMGEWPWSDREDEKEQEEEFFTWQEVSSEFGELPSHIKVYRSDDFLLDKQAIAYIATADLNETTFHVWGLNAPDLNGCKEPLQTPRQVFEANNAPALVINAGFFYSEGGKNYSSSLEVNNGKLLSPNINYASEDWKTMYAPTRGVFLEHSDGSYEVAWTYFKDAKNHWIYQNPAENSYKQSPLPTPSATFPEEGRDFEAVNGIGGGPVLLKNGEIRNTAAAELFDGPTGIMVDGSHPRTAIGVTADSRLVLFVCEGRNMTPGVAGFTTLEVAQILKDFGCTDALNLDGGGSTMMLVNGIEVIKPSDGSQRRVGSCVYVR